MRDKTFFITDAHLGSGADSSRREADLVQWLDSVAPQARRIVMLGDMFDFWFTYRHSVPRGHVRLLGKLAQLADEGIELHFFIGNHDMWLFDYLEREVGAVMHDEPTTMVWEGHRFLLGHGDGMDATDHKYNFLKRLFRSRLCQWLFAGIHPNISIPLARRWSANSRRNHSMQDNGYLGDEREAIYQYCLQQQRKAEADGQAPYDFFLFGHRHTPVSRPIGDATYFNVGNWIENRDYAVYDGETVQLLSFDPTK